LLTEHGASRPQAAKKGVNWMRPWSAGNKRRMGPEI
jgi:hypothetical protein